MMSSPSDRNLLLGILAHQMDFVSRDALFAAMLDWTGRKHTPLGQILVDRGDLAAADLAALEGLVDRHVQKHGSVEASLAAVPLSGPARETMGRITDHDVAASLNHVGAITPPPDADGTASFYVRSAEASGQRYRVLRPHACGGLGAVFVALDSELNREVALKEILDSHADDPASRHRFVVEAEITGGLEHPGIVPVYGLGAHSNGRPYYAMRFIRGDSLKEAISRFHGDAGPAKTDPSGLELRRLLRRFLDVCNAIEYAHSRGVLHRDIKPGNVIVGKHGETLVIDWGLAKPLGQREPEADHAERTLRPSSSASGSGETLPGQALGTPAYMSPEQARGELDRLGPRSDVYSLGATLYSLLTGKAPFDGKAAEVLRAVERGEFRPPRALNPAIDPALEAVCLKAMATKPEDRYASCRMLADDIERWTADEPVTVFSEPLTRRARRWARRHRTLVTAAATSLLVGLAGLGTVAAVQLKASKDLDRKNGELTLANRALEEQRERAEEREKLAIDAVKKYRDSVTENPTLKNSPELQELRKTLLKEPLAFFQSLREMLQKDHVTRPESLVTLGDAMYEFAALTDEIGDAKDSLKAYDDSLAIWQGLASDRPDNPEYRSKLGKVQSYRGTILSRIGDSTGARRAFESALAIGKNLADDYPNVTNYRNGLAAGHNNLGILLKESGDVAGARREYEAALAIIKKLVDEHPTVTRYQRNLAASHTSMGVLLRESGDRDGARREYESALAINRKLADDHPAVTQYRNDLAMIHNRIGDLLSSTGDPAGARQEIESAFLILRKLVEDHPTVTQYQGNLAINFASLGSLLRNTGDPAGARRAYESALTIDRKMANDHPAVTLFQNNVASDLGSLGSLLRETGDSAGARRAYESGLTIRRKLAKDYPASPDHSSRLGSMLNNLALLDLDDKQFDVARDRLREAITMQKKALSTNPRNSRYRQFLANHAENLRKAAAGLNDTDLLAEAQSELATLQANDPVRLALDARLAAILRGEAPKDTAERLALAKRASDVERYALAARLWGEAIAANSKVAQDRQRQFPYSAACAAALAAAGKGKDDPPPDDSAKIRLRGQALEWLKVELATWATILESGPPQARPLIVKSLKDWLDDADLASLRGDKAIDALPEGERDAWRKLWADLAALLAKAEQLPAKE